MPRGIAFTEAAACTPLARGIGEGVAASRSQEVAGSAAVWRHVTVDAAKCTGCGFYEQYCPDGAIRLHTKSGCLTRTFTPGLCADDALCALACPSDAITRGYAETGESFEPRVVLDVPIAPCERCHAPAIKTEGDLCHWCASEPPLESLLA